MNEFPSILWHSVQQRWGNVQNLADLKRHLSPVSRGFVMYAKSDELLNLDEFVIFVFNFLVLALDQ